MSDSPARQPSDQSTIRPAVPLPQRKAGRGETRRLQEVRKHRRFASLRAIGALMLREMATSHGRSAGGYLWAIAEPVGGIVLLTLIFSVGFRAPPLGTNFAIFYATGVVPFMAYLDMSNKVAGSIRYSKPLLTYPAVTFMDALIARILFSVITQAMVAVLIFSGILLMLDTRTDPQILQIALAFAMTILIATAVGVMNCFLFAAFAWWQPVWSILMRPLFLVSCIFFLFDTIPLPYREWLWWNPLVHVVGQMRKAFYPSYSGDYVSHVYVFGLGLGLIALGLTLLVRYHRDLQHS
ncbi:ABC transporter permease [Paracoccus bogoriensis]|uniref:ABC transporter permease n=1 Tax=Paracoccus bogoriensis TaxID=242065 RepID=UPI001CA55E36|nr:ABC transporter permease [Paracoccus bogoriensis]MBW7055766.1 ABC transporter permease [Paracoccus bogoriensis]